MALSTAATDTSFAKTTLPSQTKAKEWLQALQFQDTFTKHLPGDAVVSESPYNLVNRNEDKWTVDVPQAKFRASRAVTGALWSYSVPVQHEQPKLVGVSDAGAKLIGLSRGFFLKTPKAAAEIWSGNERLPNSHPWSHCYGGHQFGQWADQLGDGRAISIGEIVNSQSGDRWELQLKGAGRTPYSRFGDGYAVRRSSIREYLVAEHMHALGIPTTRSLALVFTDRIVQREEPEYGAVVTRLAQSWVRFGSFELPASRKDKDLIRKLADYIIENHFPDIQSNENRYAELLRRVVKLTAETVAKWQAVGFCHGVMNTDNMSILGLTIDYGPYAFLDAYDPAFICNHSDPGGRYAFDEQPKVALWNLLKLANPLAMLINSENMEVEMSNETVESVKAALDTYSAYYSQAYTDAMRAKFGLSTRQETDLSKVIRPYLHLLERGKSDYTFSMRSLCDVPDILQKGNLGALDQHIDQIVSRSVALSCESKVWKQDMRDYYEDVYKPRLEQENAKDVSVSMKQHNPKYVLRNWVAQDIIEQADRGNHEYIDQALALLTNYTFSDNVPESLKEMADKYTGPVPEWGEGLQCSCSS